MTTKRTYRVEEHSVVTLTYELRDANGRMLEERSEQNPSIFICGLNQVLPALEQSLIGQTKGFAKDLTLPPENAYGGYNNDLVVEVPRATFPANLKLNNGMRFNTVGPGGESLTVEITAVQGDQVILDGNHPLAGVELHFKLKVLDVRPATAEELSSHKVSGNTPPTYH